MDLMFDLRTEREWNKGSMLLGQNLLFIMTPENRGIHIGTESMTFSTGNPSLEQLNCQDMWHLITFFQENKLKHFLKIYAVALAHQKWYRLVTLLQTGLRSSSLKNYLSTLNTWGYYIYLTDKLVHKNQ